MEHDVFLKKYTTHLNENQLKAVQTVDGPVLLFAVPGSGKTTVLVTRLGYMIYCSDISPQNILTLTYTVSATKDMQMRFEKIFGEGSSQGLEMRTPVRKKSSTAETVKPQAVAKPLKSLRDKPAYAKFDGTII